MNGNSSPSGSRQALQQLVIIMGGMILMGIGAVVFPGNSWVDMTLLVAAGITILSVLFIRSQITPPERDSPGPPEPASPSADDIIREQQAVYEQYGKGAVAYFVQLLTGTPLYLARVNEDAELHVGSMLMTTSLTMRISKEVLDNDAASSILVPLIVAKRGVLYNRLQVSDGSGDVTPTLSQHEVRGLLAATALILFEFARQKASLGAPTVHDAKIMQNLIEKALCHTERIDKKKFLEIQDALGALDNLDDPIPLYWKHQIRRLCDTFSRHYLIVVEARKPELRTLRLTYSHEAPTDRHGYSINERRRARFGLSPASADVVLTRLFQAESYHFQMKAPDGQYVFHHKLERVSTNTR